MEKIDIQTLGYVVVEYDKDGKPFADMYSPQKAITDIADKINEIIDYLNKNKEA